MSEDEIRMKHDFEKKEAAWLEEREKMKKVYYTFAYSTTTVHCTCMRTCTCTLYMLYF